MNSKSSFFFGLCLVFLMSLLPACGPSQESLDATATKNAEQISMTQTAEAPTATLTPKPTSTETPTPSPTPIPDAKAMLRWQDLYLPITFKSFPPSNIGLEEGAIAYTTTFESNSVNYPVAGSFLFGDEDANEFLYGYSILFSTAQDREGFNDLMNDFEYFVGTQFSSYLNYGYESLTDMNNMGDLSKGASATFTYNNTKYRVDEVAFRAGKIAAFVFSRYSDGIDPSIEIGELARIYAESILNPPLPCRLTLVEAEKGATWPSYHFIAEGFYPGEGRLVTLSGDPLVSMLAGGGGESADAEGRIEDVINYGVLIGDDVQYPTELTLTVTGYASGCDATQVVPWPLP
jgi:hypothetical protein